MKESDGYDPQLPCWRGDRPGHMGIPVRLNSPSPRLTIEAMQLLEAIAEHGHARAEHGHDS